MTYINQPSQLADLPAILMQALMQRQQRKQFDTSLATSQANRAEDNARRDRELAGQIQREQQQKLLQALFHSKDVMGSSEYAGQLKELTGVDLGPQAPNRVDMTRSPQGAATGLPPVMPGLMGGSMNLPTHTPWSELQLAANNLPSDYALKAQRSAAQRTIATNEAVAGASPEQLRAGENIPTKSQLDRSGRDAVSDYAKQALGLVQEQFFKNDTLDPKSQLSPDALANVAFNAFANQHRGDMTPEQIEGTRASFQQAAGEIDEARQKLQLSRDEVRLRRELMIADRDNPQVYVNYMQTLTNQANSIKTLIPDAALFMPPDEAKEAFPQAAAYIDEFNDVQNKIRVMQPQVEKLLKLSGTSGSGVTGSTPSPLDDSAYQASLKALRKKSPQEQSAFLQEQLGKTLTQDDYNKFSRDLKLATPARTDSAAKKDSVVAPAPTRSNAPKPVAQPDTLDTVIGPSELEIDSILGTPIPVQPPVNIMERLLTRPSNLEVPPAPIPAQPKLSAEATTPAKLPTVNINAKAPTAEQVAAAILQVETGGKYEAKGASGEGGGYQFMPATWKEWAGKYLGDSSAKMTRENQDKVAIARIKDLQAKGLNPREIALMWNGGDTKEKAGVNRFGVKYDTKAYADKVMSQLEALLRNP